MTFSAFRGSALPWVAAWVRGVASAERLQALADPRVRELLRLRWLRSAAVAGGGRPRHANLRPPVVAAAAVRKSAGPTRRRAAPAAGPDLAACFRAGHDVVGIRVRRCRTCAGR